MKDSRHPDYAFLVLVLFSAFCLSTIVMGEPAAAVKVQDWTAKLNALAQSVSGWAIPTLLGTIVEFAVRLKPSQKPLSVIWAIVGLLKIGAALMQASVNVLSAIATKADQFFPQKLKEELPKE